MNGFNDYRETAIGKRETPPPTSPEQAVKYFNYRSDNYF